MLLYKCILPTNGESFCKESYNRYTKFVTHGPPGNLQYTSKGQCSQCLHGLRDLTPTATRDSFLLEWQRLRGVNWEVGGSRMGKEAGLQRVDKGRYEQERRKTRKLYNGREVIGPRYMGEYLSKGPAPLPDDRVELS